MELMLKIQISAFHPTSNTTESGVLRHRHFCELNSTFNGNSHYKSFAIFLRTDAKFYQMTLPHTLRRGPNESTMTKIKCNQSYSFKEGLKFTIVLIQR